MNPTEQAPTREGKSGIWPGKVEEALARGECTALDPCITEAGSPLTALEPEVFSSDPQIAACVFSALFFRKPEHPRLSRWADRARECLEFLPWPTRLTLARRLLRYDHFFGRPTRTELLVNVLRAQHVARQRSPDVQIQWGLLQALHLEARGEHADCLEAAHKTLALASRDPDCQWTSTLRALEISASLGLGEMEIARRAWETSLAEQPQHGLLGAAYLHQLGARIALADRNTALALEHTDTALQIATRAGAPLFRALAGLAMTEVHLERSMPEATEPSLHEAEQTAQTTGSAQLACLSSFMLAYRALASNAHADIDNDLRLGFGLASRYGYRNFMWWSPRIMTTLCLRALERDVETNYVQQLVQSRRLMPTATPVHVETWPWPVKIYTLGRFTVLTDNQPARAGRKAQHKPLELLKALIAQGGREVGEDTLTAALWPDAEGDTARQAFDTTLHRLRRLLGNDQAIVLHNRRLSLDHRLCWVDAWAFERLLSEAETLFDNPADPDGTALANLADRVQAFYHGPFLGKEFGAAWSISLRERLRSRYLRHVVSIGARWQQLGHWDRAIECYRKGLEVDDLAEQLYQNLMLCHQQLGQRSEALSVYRRCRFVLSVVLGIAPSPATESLHQRLRSGL